MNSRERVLTAISHHEPDRVPITFDAEKEVIELLKEYFHVSSRDEVWDMLHVDTRLIGADHHYHHIREKNGISYDFWGSGSEEKAYNGGTYFEFTQHPLASMETVRDIENYDWPTPDELSFESLREARKNNPDKAVIAYLSLGGFFEATHLQGLEQFMLDLGMDMGLALKIVEKITDYLFPAIERLCIEAKDDFDIFYMADDFCTARGPLFSPQVFRTLVKPYLEQIAGIVHKNNKKFLLHVCGSVREFLPDIIETGVDMLEPIQTSAVGMEVESLKADFGDSLTFYGSIDLINILSKGKPEDVRREVLKNFRILGKGGGVIVGPGHTYIQPDVPLPNILTMYQTAYEDCIY
ncbi:MAG: uroporphyrinogen decarboxylase family protein [Victivallales bacterium]|nr:uroporphyrinogen decarboxylase family protein [Victivallales bacterium]